ncbi:MAG TPA: hypothetical protein VFC03_16160 [Acidimicrobiales bacterium]|jgi:hypothetical protein|nr:hypothetical protein [Acidimicrobiales bacterium]
MGHPSNARAGGQHRSTSSALSPYLIEEIALTPSDLRRSQVKDVVFVVSH